MSMNRNESKYFNTAARMDEALLALLEKKDFEFITVREICEAAGVNRSTFYLHYENTRELLDESVGALQKSFGSASAASTAISARVSSLQGQTSFCSLRRSTLRRILNL